jgi:hypothetical protein
MAVKTVRDAPLRNERRYMENESISNLHSEKSGILKRARC